MQYSALINPLFSLKIKMLHLLGVKTKLHSLKLLSVESPVKFRQIYVQ